ncbi:MAG TPA: 2-amino-4-hydroxy-6-hydroxymethyldihydropteridine diphosphokinase [Candidatus Tumulicola sp.]|jgi:2-amino-4-hydroxy-6-hydroxymethyldihydropteridine diphosphokinase
MSAHRAYVGLGANLGDPAAQLARALGLIEELGTVSRRSSLYRTRAWGKTDQPDFINAVVLLETELAPAELLAALRTIETRLGRTSAPRWAPRKMDLDLLTYDECTIVLPGLRVPHPRLRERAFVLVPLAEIDSRYEAARAALAPRDLAGVVKVAD